MKKLFTKRMVALLLTVAMAFSTLAFTVAAADVPQRDINKDCIKLGFSDEFKVEGVTGYMTALGEVQLAVESGILAGMGETKEDVLKLLAKQFKIDAEDPNEIELAVAQEILDLAPEVEPVSFPKGAAYGFQWNGEKVYWYTAKDYLAIAKVAEAEGETSDPKILVALARDGIYNGIKAINYVDPKPNTPAPDGGDGGAAVVAVVGGAAVVGVGGYMLYTYVPQFKAAVDTAWARVKSFIDSLKPANAAA